MSFKPEVQTDRTGKWHDNGLRFETFHEAMHWVADPSFRWASVRSTRVVESPDPANYQFINRRMTAITEIPNAKAK